MRRTSVWLLVLAGLCGSPAYAQQWSNPATWPGGQVPQAGAAVTIMPNTTVVLDTDPPPLASLMIMGRLVFADGADRALTAGWIMIHGQGAELAIGSEAQPYQSRATITLTGTNEAENVMGVSPLNSGTKFIMPMDGGTLRLHGATRAKRAWTVLTALAAPGGRTLQLRDAVNWSVGDRIVVAPSGFTPAESEVVTITALNGNAIEVSPPLYYRHWGTTQTLGSRVLDARAEVGLLSRNIVIRGADDSLASNFGGHVMVMGNARAYVEGVEFVRMGQLGHKGRYPFHWHWVTRTGNSAVGQYFRNNSVHQSFHRAVVVHGTSGVTVSDNVSFDVTSHAFVAAEDGDESGNVFERNLAVLTRTVHASADFAFPGGENFGLQNEGRAAAFWLKNPNNVLRGNRAAGVEGGHGFFIDGEFMKRFAGDGDSDGMVRAAVGTHVFEDNLAHSISKGGDLPYEPGDIGAGAYVGLNRGNGLFVREATTGARSAGMLRLLRFQAYKTVGSSVWLERENELLEGAVLADTPAGVDAKSGIVRASTIQPRTANDIGGRRHGYNGVFYNDSCDDGFILEDSEIIDAWDGAVMSTDDFAFGDCRSRRLSLTRSLPIQIEDRATGSWLDEDGTLTGMGAGRLSNYALDSRSIARAAWHGYYTPLDGAPVPGQPSIEIIKPRPDSVDGDAGNFSAPYVLVRVVDWPMTQGGAHWRLSINGTLVATRYDSLGLNIDGRDLPPSFQVGANTLRAELYTAAGQATGVAHQIQVNWVEAPTLRLVPPSGGVMQPFALAFACGYCRYRGPDLPRRIYRVLVDGQPHAWHHIDDPVRLDELAGGVRQVTLQLVDAETNAVVASDTIPVTILNGFVPDLLLRDGYE